MVLATESVAEARQIYHRGGKYKHIIYLKEIITSTTSLLLSSYIFLILIQKQRKVTTLPSSLSNISEAFKTIVLHKTRMQNI